MLCPLVSSLVIMSVAASPSSTSLLVKFSFVNKLVLFNVTDLVSAVTVIQTVRMREEWWTERVTWI